MSLFGGHSKQSNYDQIAQMLHDHLGLQLAQPSNEVVNALDQMTTRELHQFENLHSVEGMQALFRARALQAFVDPKTQTVALFPLESQAPVEQAPDRPVLRIGDRHATQSIVRPPNISMLGAQPVAPALAQPVVPLPGSLEHLEAMEHLLPQIVDLFVRHGRLNTADKDVLKQIRPTDSSIEARLTALERWQAEVGRRVRGIHVQRATSHLLLGAEEATQQVKPEETHGRRFDAAAIWISKLVKAFEHTGIKFHNKPMWLPH